MNPNRRRFLISATAALVAASPARAQDDAATRSVVRQLEGQGFDVISIRRTLLGRVRVVSRRGDLEREIVFDPRNGAIMRDYTSSTDGTPSLGPAPGDGDGGSRSGSASQDQGSGGGDDGGGNGGGSNGGGGDGGGNGGGGGGSGSQGSGGQNDDDDDDDDDDDGDDGDDDGDDDDDD